MRRGDGNKEDATSFDMMAFIISWAVKCIFGFILGVG